MAGENIQFSKNEEIETHDNKGLMFYSSEAEERVFIIVIHLSHSRKRRKNLFGGSGRCNAG